MMCIDVHKVYYMHIYIYIMGSSREFGSVVCIACIASSKGQSSCESVYLQAAIAQLGERQTEDLKVPTSILGLGIPARPGLCACVEMHACGTDTPSVHCALCYHIHQGVAAG